MNGARPAAWYRDPQDPAWIYRYWNGNDWTEHTAPVRQTPYSEETNGSRPAAWYRDPQDPAWHYRYWNGNDWTEHTAPIPQTPYSGDGPTYSATYSTGSSSGSWAGFLIVPAAILLLMGLFTACSSSSSGVNKDTPECDAYRALLILKDGGADLTWHEVESAGDKCRNS
jgi:hypothetical protein